LGVKSETWKMVSVGKSNMPYLCIDGVMYGESDQIVLMLAEKTNAPPEVKESAGSAVGTRRMLGARVRIRSRPLSAAWGPCHVCTAW